jgi:hypothetical protein
MLITAEKLREMKIERADADKLISDVGETLKLAKKNGDRYAIWIPEIQQDETIKIIDKIVQDIVLERLTYYGYFYIISDYKTAEGISDEFLSLAGIEKQPRRKIFIYWNEAAYNEDKDVIVIPPPQPTKPPFNEKEDEIDVINEVDSVKFAGFIQDAFQSNEEWPQEIAPNIKRYGNYYVETLPNGKVIVRRDYQVSE